jgi:murein DD-endopeptidase MepM/ murein hydrolase activator NlpD
MITVDPNALLATQVQAIQANPVSTQRPDLVHFRPLRGAADTAEGAGGVSGRGPGGGMLAPAIAVVVVTVLLAATSLVLRRRRRLPHGLRRALTVAPLFGAAQAAVIAFAVAGHGVAPAAHAPLAPTVASTPGTVLSALRAHSVSLPAGSASRTWSSLVSIESDLTWQHDSLVADEQAINAITPQLGTLATGRGFARRPGAMGVLQTVLRQAVANHEAVLSAYNASLQHEYNFFVDAAQSPQAATELRTVAQHTPPDVQTAVATDLNLVQTQLQQEAQIAAAQASNPTLPQLLNGSALKFHAPVGGVVSQPFGPTSFALEPPITYGGVFYPHFHTGLDIAAPLDTPVHAAAGGVVVLATSSVDTLGHLAGYGNYVVISHGSGFMTLYGHLDRLLVNPGQTVQPGQTIGLLGSTGWSTGPHVHFEIRKNGTYVDPVPYIADDLR